MATYLKVEIFGNLFPLRSKYNYFSFICLQAYVIWSELQNNERERSWFICLLIFFIDVFEYRRFVSSAKCSILLCLTDLWRSLMKMINNNGPYTDPCGTPWVTKLSSESKPLTDVYWTLWDKNDWNQSTAWPFIPWSVNLFRNISWFTVLRLF